MFGIDIPISELISLGAGLGAAYGLAKRRALKIYREGMDVYNAVSKLNFTLRNARADDKITMEEVGSLVEQSGQVLQEFSQLREAVRKVF